MSWFGGACSGRNTAQELLFDTENGAGLSQANLTSSQSDQYIDWGDGSPIEDFSTNKIHNYAEPGQYRVRIWTFNRDASGSLENSWGWGGNQDFLSQINNWGPAKTKMYQQYLNCDYMSFSPYIRDYPVPHTSGTQILWYQSFRTFYDNPSISWTIEEPPALYWDTSYVTRMDQMFLGSADLNTNVSSWDTSNVTKMDNMFFSSFLGNPTGLFNNGFTFGATGATVDGTWVENVLPWDTSNVTTFYRMFYYQNAFASDISSWDVSSATNLGQSLSYTSQNSNLSSWNTSNATSMNAMFRGASLFNCGLASGATHTRMYNWDTSSNTDMQFMFDDADAFNGDISRWNTSNVTTMYRTFANATDFTCGGATGISWDTSNVTDMAQMFQYQQKFNCDIRTWDVSSVTSFNTFMVAFGTLPIFNNGFSSGTSYTWNWNPSSATLFGSMFRNCASMNGDIGGWNVSNGETFFRMLVNASSFDQDISGWQFKSYASGPPSMGEMLNNTNLSVENYSRFLISLANQAYDDVNGYLFNGTLGASSLQYNNNTYTGYGSGQFTDAVSARAYLTGVTGGWTITGDSQV